MLKVVYSIIPHSWKTNLLYRIEQVNILQGKSKIEGERAIEKGERERETESG